MATDTKIEWCDATANFWEGCTQISPACDFCYAKARAERFGSVEWNGPPREVRAGYGVMHALEHRALYHPDFTPFVFVNSLSDFFDKLAPAQWRAKALLNMVRAQRCRFLLLTKRIGNVEKMIEEAGHGWPPNAWLGSTVVNQEEADRDIPKLLLAKAALSIPKVFLSIEPMLASIDLSDRNNGWYFHNYLSGNKWHDGPGLSTVKRDEPGIDWVICGGESGRGARPMHPDWARSLRDQCAAAGVPFMFKQWGEWGPDYKHGAPIVCFRPDGSRYNPKEPDGWTEKAMQSVYRVGKKAAGRLLDDVEHNGRPQP